MIHRTGIYRNIHDVRGWCVARWTGYVWHRVSNFYMYRGWAQNFARRMGIRVENYESLYA